jgi:hypothetical protein
MALARVTVVAYLSPLKIEPEPVRLGKPGSITGQRLDPL